MQNIFYPLVRQTLLAKKIVKISTIVFFVCFSLLIQFRAYAQGPSIVPDDGKKAGGNYEVNDFVLVAINVSKWVLILSGSLALLAFIVGGLMFILSGGNRELVEKGKSSMIAATIGIIVVLLAFTAINYFMTKMGYDEATFGGGWHTAP